MRERYNLIRERDFFVPENVFFVRIIGGFTLTVSKQLEDWRAGGGADRFRIKIWDRKTGIIAYDNQIESDDNAEITTVLVAG